MRARMLCPIVACLLLFGFQSPADGPRHVTVPLACSRGPSGQSHGVTVTVPACVSPGARYKVRVDGVDTGKIAYTGLRYIFDMRSEWPVPQGTTYVDGSAHIVPGTGSANVRPGAQAVYDGGHIDLVLPARVGSGASYTAPSFEFELDVSSPEGAQITLRLSRYYVTANALLVGDLHTTCEPTPKPFPVAVTRVAAGT
ncbi:MAG TPA: hypothetical protein VK762_19910 [Polyangiaceae bacterium]|nr:hypothetical protein [Polyangiaceae bacterium]